MREMLLAVVATMSNGTSCGASQTPIVVVMTVGGGDGGNAVQDWVLQAQSPRELLNLWLFVSADGGHIAIGHVRLVQLNAPECKGNAHIALSEPRDIETHRPYL
jgi:hypothetical protein